ncbi:MAG TPA: hypothetical protein PKM88_15055, partial [bacterium]|nr:hypothetical protein [bacterium]
IAGMGTASSDTTYVCSYTWGSANIGTINGISGGNTMGLNYHSASGGVPDYLIFDDDGSESVNAQAKSDADVTDVGDANGSPIMHIKDIFVANQGYCITSANHTAGGFNSQYNNVIYMPWWAMAAGLRGKIADQMQEMAGGIFHDATQYLGGDIFLSPYGDTVEKRFSPDDNDGTYTAGTGSTLGRLRQLVAGCRESVFFLQDGWSSSNGTDALRDDIINRTGIIWRGCAGSPATYSDWDATTFSSFQADANGTLRNQPGDYNLLHSKIFIFDMDIVATGSPNTTAAALYYTGGNDESHIIIHDFRLARRFMTHYHKVMTDAGITNDPSSDQYDATAPNGATGLTVTPGKTSFTLSWTPSTSTDISRYYLFIDTAALTQNGIGDRVDDDGDGYYDEDPRGDYDGFSSGATAAAASAADDDADGSTDEDPWLPPEVQVKGKTSASGVISSYNVGDTLQAGVNYYFAVVAVDTQGNEGTIATAGPYKLLTGVMVTNTETLAATSAAIDADKILVQSVTLAGHSSTDTINAVKVGNTGSCVSSDVTQLELWADNGNGSWDAGDTRMAGLVWGGSTWDTSGLAYPVGLSGANFLITADFSATVSYGDTFQARLPVYAFDMALQDSGPSAILASARVVTIAPLTISGTAPIQATTQDSGSIARLYTAAGVNVDT